MSSARLFAAILVILALWGCGGQQKPAAPRAGGASAPANLTSLPPRQQLEQLAQREASQRPPRGFVSPDVPLPPDVEPAALAPRARNDAHAHMPLNEVLQQYAKRGEEDAPIPLPAEIDPEQKARAVKHYAKARQTAMDGRWLQAILELQKAHQLDPTSTEVLRELARCYLAENRSAQAEHRSAQAIEAYERLLRLEPGNAEALFAIAMASTTRRDFDRAVELLARFRLDPDSSDHDPATQVVVDFTLASALRELGYDRAMIEAAVAAVNIPDELVTEENAQRLATVYRQRGELWRAVGDAHSRLGEYSQAHSAYMQSASVPTADPAALHPRLVYVNLRMGRPYSAQLTMLKAVAAHRPVQDRDIRLCTYLFKHAQPVDALASAVRELHAQNEDDVSLVRAAASLMSAEQARGMFREYVARRPRDLVGVQHLFASIGQDDFKRAVDLAVTLATEHRDLADAYADRLLLALPDASAVLASLRELPESVARAQLEAKVMWKAGGLGEAWHACAAARTRWPDDVHLAVQQIQLAAALQESALLEQAAASSPPLEDVASLLAVSQARRALGQTQLAVDLARQASQIDPESTEALIELSRAQLAHAGALASDPDARAGMRVALDQAVFYAERAIEADPKRDDAYEVLTLIYLPGGLLADTNLLRQTLQQLRENHPQSALFGRIAAQDALTQRRFEQAVDRLLGLYDRNLADAASLSAAVTAWQQWGKLDLAEQWLDQRLAQRPKDPVLLEHWVRVQLLLNRGGAVITKLEQMLASDPRDFSVRRLLETVYRASGMLDAAMALGEQRLLARPEGVRRNIELAALYAGAERAEPAAQQLQRVLELAHQATLEELSSTVRVLTRLREAGDEYESLNLRLMQRTIELHPDAPLQVYGSALRSLAKLNQVDDQFDALAQQAVTHAKAGAGATAQYADQWREIAQALVNDGDAAAAARAARTRLHSDARLDPDAAGLLMRVTVFADAAAELADGSPDHAARSLQTIELMHERGLLVLNQQEHANRDVIGVACYEVSVFYTIIGSRSGADFLLHRAIARDSQLTMAMNNLGYAQLEAGHSDDGMIELILRAHAQMPEDPSILDTVGWLRYKQGQFEDAPNGGADGAASPGQRGALSLILQAIARAQEPSPEVFDHLGDVYWRLGQRDRAMEAWRKAASLIEDQAFMARVLQFNQVVQSREWRLLVMDPRAMYDREYGPIRDRANRKIAAARAGEEPPVAPIFAELD